MNAASTAAIEASRMFMHAADRLPTLYSLSAEWHELLAMLEDPEQDVAAIEAELQRLAGDIKHKAHGVALVIQSLENLAELQKAESQRLAAKAKASQAHADRLREYARQNMQAIPGLQRIETGVFTLAIRLNNPSVTVVDEHAVAAEFWRTYAPPPPEVNKVAIMEHWRATGGRSTKDGLTGGDVPAGVAIVRNERLVIS